MKVAISAGCLVFAASAASAQNALPAASGPGLVPYDKGWTGEASLSGNVTTGNTETSEVGLAVKLGYEMGLWRHAFIAAYDFGTASGVETKNRANVDYQADRLINDRVFAFGRIAYQQDHFSGYDYRGVIATGLGVDILRGDVRSWNVRGGPGVQIDKTVVIVDPATGAITPPEETDKGALSLGSRFSAKINSHVTITDDADATIGEDSNKMLNSLALTSELAMGFAVRVSFDVAHDTNPPDTMTQKTDTISRASLVYHFGG